VPTRSGNTVKINLVWLILNYIDIVSIYINKKFFILLLFWYKY